MFESWFPRGHSTPGFDEVGKVGVGGSIARRNDPRVTDGSGVAAVGRAVRVGSAWGLDPHDNVADAGLYFVN